MIKRIKVSFDNGTGTFAMEDREVEIENNCSWYTVQNYFNDTLLHELMPGHSIIIHWYNGKVYEFRRRKTDDDQRHKEGRKKRAPRNRKAA